MGRHSRENSTGELKGAFVTIPALISAASNGIGEANAFETSAFALELTAKKGHWKVGNCIGGIAVPQSVHEQSISALDPNGIPCIASSFDDICLVLRTNTPRNDLEDFYTTILGMTVVSSFTTDPFTSVELEGDTGTDGSTMPLCLCYQIDKNALLPTTMLVFLQSEIPIQQGDCFDHLVIEIDETQTSIAEEYSRITSAMETAKECASDQTTGRNCSGALLMKPTTMFGTSIMGVRDPSGYKVYLTAPGKPL